MKTSAIFLFSLLLSSFMSFATVCSSVTSGPWNSAATWSCGVVPSAGDTIIISVGDNVTLSNNTDMTSTSSVLIIHGVLLFDSPGAKLRLGCGSSVYISGTGSIQDSGVGTPSHSLRICGVDVWQGPDGTLSGPVIIGVPLPIELVYFTATANDRDLDFEWATASESNNDYFIIEESIDGEVWNNLAVVDGAGTSQEQNNYSYSDYSNESTYFRLKQVDFNGEFTLSNIITVKRNVSSEFEMYPNPLNGESLKLQLPEGSNSVVILSMTGRTVYSLETNDNRNVWIKDLNIPNGIYLVNVYTQLGVVTKKLMVND